MSGLRLAYYGDDFTGSTDAMEALAQNGLKTVLFLQPPTQGQLDKFADLQAFGIAGVGRSLSPAEMESELLAAFQAMKQSGAMVMHYKTCSTFDSSPHTGSIGKAMELGRSVFDNQRFIPLVVGVPQLKRYTAFGHHFAAVGEEIYRLDRHPVMSRHPVTPMDNSDLLQHLSGQTVLGAGLINMLQLMQPLEQVRKTLQEKLDEQRDIILFDVIEEGHLGQIAALLSQEEGQLFTVGSSGIEYAFVQWWQRQGLVEKQPCFASRSQSVDRIAVVSGSCSPVTGEQIRYAEQHGFSSYKLPAECLVIEDEQTAAGMAGSKELTASAWTKEQYAAWIKELTAWTKQQFAAGKHVLFYSAAGPDDESIAHMRQRFAEAGLQERDTAERIGQTMGRISKALIEHAGVRRIVAAGGDTSGYVTRELGIYALETLELVDPGVPLCVGYSEQAGFDGIEVALKGGQMGTTDFFVKLSEL